MKKLYAERDMLQQGDYYFNHLSAMTAEGLYLKSSIAAELAHRDIEIDRLRAETHRIRAERDILKSRISLLKNRGEW